MAKRVDYQNPLDNLEEVYEKRNAQIRAWAKADQERADALIGVPTDITTFDDWDVLEPDTGKVDPPGGEWQLTEEPKEEKKEEEKEEEEQPDAVPASADAIAEVTGAEDPDPTPEPQDPVKEEAKEEPKKAPAKKAAAAPKEASSKA